MYVDVVTHYQIPWCSK